MMLYRHKQGTFEVCPYKAVYTALVNQIVKDKTIEIDGEQVMQYKQVEVEKSREIFVYNKEIFERTLSNSSERYKDLSYEGFTLTEEQQTRFEQIRNLPESAIGSCIDYINGGAFPKELENIQLAQELSEREINEIKLAQLVSEMEIKIFKLGV